MKGKVTKTSVDALIADAKATAGAVFLWDHDLAGFGVKATPGACSYILQYRMGGRGTPTKRLTLGPHGKLTPEQARKVAKAELGKVSNGVDVAEHRKEKREKLAGLTFTEAVDKFLNVHAKPTRYWHEKAARLRSGDVKALANKPLTMVSRKHVADAIDRAKARAEGAARLLYSDLRPFFKWAHEREYTDANPMAGLPAPKPAKARDRALDDDEIRAFWRAASEAAWPFASVYKLLLLTGARREEVAAMRWPELDFEKGVWGLPSREDFVLKRRRRNKTEWIEGRTKNTRAHRVPLPPMAIALLDRATIAMAKAGGYYPLDSDLVFSTTGNTPPSGFSKAKHQLDLRMAELLGSKWDEKAGGFVGGKFKPWRVHDLRRTCATGMENLGIDTRVVETALNHVSGTKAGIVGVYQRAEHREAVKAAFEAWARYIAELTGDSHPSNIVPLKRTVAR
jgi:integrase